MEGKRRKAREIRTVNGKVLRIQDGSKRTDRNKGNSSFKKDRGRGRTFRYIQEVKKRDWNENAFLRPNGLREHDRTATPCRGHGPVRKKK